MGWDGIGMDLRVGGGIEHLTVLITITITITITSSSVCSLTQTENNS